MAKMGRPPAVYTITRTRPGDAVFVESFTVPGAVGVSEVLGITKSEAHTVLRILGGNFSRNVLGKDGVVYEERVQRVA